MMNIKEMRNRVEQIKGKRQSIREYRKEIQKKLSVLKEDLHTIEEARTIIQKVAQQTQEELEYSISQIVSSAMSAVFDEPYEIKFHFIIKRGKTEVEIKFYKEGLEIDPMNTGGGVIDVAAFAIQIALWSLQNPKTRPTLILDEPLKWLKGGELPDRGAAMIKQLSRALDLQIIMVSHSPELIENADKVIKVVKRKGVSYVQ